MIRMEAVNGQYEHDNASPEDDALAVEARRRREQIEDERLDESGL